MIELFIFADGCCYSLEFNEEWHDLIEDPDQVLNRISGKYSEQIDAHRKRKSTIEAEKLRQVEQSIMDDPTFICCTTKDARLRFVVDYMIKNGIKHNMRHSEMQSWADLLWAQRKARK